MPEYEYQSPYNDPSYNISSMPSYQPYQTPKPTEPPPPAKLSPRAKAGLSLGFAAVAAAGVFTWSQYEQSQADAHIRAQQVAVQAAQVELAQEQQATAQAKAAEQETPAQRARRLAVEACVDKAGSNSDAVAACGQVYPVTGSLADVSTAASTSDGSKTGSNVGLIVLGSIGAVLVGGYIRKSLPRSS